MTNKNGSVLVAMSGGVDSSVTAFLLNEQGYDVIGVTMRLQDGDEPDINHDRPCCSVTMATRAAAVCKQLDVPHYVVDFRNEFRKGVMDDFFEQYISGYTPNPCVRCNTFIKWAPLVNKQKMLGADFIATGHYSRITKDEETGQSYLLRGVDQTKDQSYFLWGLSGEHIAKTFFPLGDMTKKEVRALAAKYKLATAAAPESQDICFIPNNDYRTFISKRLQEANRTMEDGVFVDSAGNEIGAHAGYFNFTIGQRRGLGLSLGKKFFVTGIDSVNNIVTVGDEEGLSADILNAYLVNWINGVPDEKEIPIDEIKIRYRDPGAPGRVQILDDGSVSVKFDNPVKAVTPGQSVVFYKKDRVIGGGIISAENS